MISNDQSKIHGANWISLLSQDIFVSELSIPGTHDSAAYSTPHWYNCFITPCWKTQDFDILEQLSIGIRYLDIRIRFSSGKQLEVYHDKVYLCKFEDIALIIKQFLRQNPSEFIIMQVQKEGGEESEKQAGIHFREVAANLSFPAYYCNHIPQIKQVRGKTWIIQTNLQLGSFKICTWNSKRVIQGRDYVLQNFWEGPKDLKLSSACKIMKQSSIQNVLKINYMSQSYIFPFRTVKKMADQYHVVVQQCINEGENALGIIVMNYPSEALVKKIVAYNFSTKVKSRMMGQG